MRLIVHLSPYAADIDRFNSANEPQDSCVSVRLLSILNIGRMLLSGSDEAVGIDSGDNPDADAESSFS